MNPPDAKTIADFLVTEYQQEIQTIERVLAAVPAGNLDYQPDGKGKTGLGLVRHLRAMGGKVPGIYGPSADTEVPA